VPIGTAILNTRIHVLDDELNPLPLGEVGEIYIAGAGVARGYLFRPGLTAERFLPDISLNGARMYRTGDLGWFDSHGDLHYLGRSDTQVKLRGFRIELGEIEATLRQHPELVDAAVTVRSTTPLTSLLVAFVVRKPNVKPVDERSLRRFLGDFLPDYMVPNIFVFVACLPLGPGGKLDRTQLAELNLPGGSFRSSPRMSTP
jgi:pristinamycin I synthase-3/4